MSDSRDKEPDLGRVEDVDDSTGNVAPLRTEATDPDPEPSFSAAHGLTTRDQPGGTEAEVPGNDDEPGASLRRAREAAGHDTASLARRIHLGRGTLEDLESNRFQHMPPAYVRGYLRSCARELGVDAGPWIEAFERHGLVDPELRAVATPSARARHQRRGRGIYWLALLLFAILLGLGVYAWSERTGTPVLPSLNLGDAREAVPGLGGTQDADVDPPGPPETIPSDSERAEPETPAPAGVAEEAPVEETAESPMTGPGGDDSAEAAAETAPPGVTAESLTERLAVPEEPATPDVAALPETESVAEADSGPAEAGDGAELVLTFEETSWVEIRDADDEVVLTGVLSSGDRETLRLELPGRVILGNAPGVSLTLDGEPVDLEPHIRSDRTARFDLEG
ncbi:helix-turn-helix domain-containing protein [Thioalkalivibrio sp. AKL19]|uniref:helix-turn-helix domain-containing protein n=1 Tax=Thioalkalivibrio sp. AKL19 TaxID=1266914 RepID=UPI0003F982CE|nr:helix-turn-helix domain-containing protein [Thioalkalivibrio sp. AKL19]